MRQKKNQLSILFFLNIALCTGDATAGTLELHGIFSSNMVIQREKPITIWGWAEPGHRVSIQFGREKTEATAGGEAGRWEVTFPARQADVTGRKLTVTSGDETIEMENILIGDVWVMNGQSNMAWGLHGTLQADMERAFSASNSLFQLDLGADSAALKARCYTSLGRSLRIEATTIRRAESPLQEWF